MHATQERIDREFGPAAWRVPFCWAAHSIALTFLLSPFSPSAAASPWETPRCAALGVGTRWVLLDPQSGKHNVFIPPPEYSIERVAAFPGCGRIAFTGHTPDEPQTLLYTCATTDCRSTRRSIGDPTGFHGDPALDLSGQWVYFIHNKRAAGPMGGHGDRAFLEVFRVRTDGTSLTQLTSAKGCHLGPSPLGPLGFLFIQTDCRIGKWVERGVVGQEKQTQLGAGPVSATEISVSPDSKLALTSIVHVDTIAIDRFSIAAPSRRTHLTDFRRGASSAQLAWGKDSNEFYYWRDSSVVRNTAGKDSIIKTLTNSD